MFETKGRTFGELDYMVGDAFPCLDASLTLLQFQKGVPARKSAKREIDEGDLFSAEDSHDTK
jgi:hypothetical protein